MKFPKRGSPEFRGLGYIAGGLAVVAIAMTLFLHEPSTPATPSVIETASENKPAQTASDAASHDASSAKLTVGDGREPFSALADALAESNRDHRLEALRHLAESLAARDVQAALEMGAQIPDGNDRIEFLRAVDRKSVV